MYREFTKSLIFRDCDDALKSSFRYVRLSYYTHYYQQKKSENRHTRPVTEGTKLRRNPQPPLPPFNEGLALINPVFCPTTSTDQKHLKLGQCLEIDDRRSLSKFGDVT